MKPTLNKYKLTLYSFLLGCIWIIPVIIGSIDSDNLALKGFYFLFIFPGVAFPVIVLIALKNYVNYRFSILYVFLSWLIYFSTGWIVSAEKIWDYFPVIAGFWGAFAFILLTKLLVVNKISFLSSIVGGVFGALSLIFIYLSNYEFIAGLSLATWTWLVGWIINIDVIKKKTGHNIVL